MAGFNTVSGNEDPTDKKNDADIDEAKVKAPNMFKRAKEEIDAVIGAIHERKSSKDESDKMEFKSEKQGDEARSDRKIHAEIDETKVKAPNMFERAKEEIDAVIGAIHQRKSSKDDSDKMEFKSEKQEDEKKKTNMIRKAKQDIKSLFHKDKPHRHHHHKETHGRSDDINENTPVEEVKAPNVLERAKEEIEAVMSSIHPKKNETDASCDSPLRSRSASPVKERAGLGCSLGKGLEKICSPWGDHKKD